MIKRKQLGAYLNSTTSWYLTHPFEFFTDLYREIRDFVLRGLYGYGHSDVWSLNSYLASWLPHAFRDLEKYSLGCPQQLFDGSKDDDECWKWREILLDISNGFEAYYELEGDLDWTPEKQKEVDKKLKKSLKLMSDWYGGLWN